MLGDSIPLPIFPGEAMMQHWLHRLGVRFRYRITHHSKFPKGDLIAFFYQLAARGFFPRHIIDVGANQGKWSRKAHSVFPDCTFTLIEPQREMQPKLETFCRRVPGSRWICAGAGSEPGELTLTVNPDTVSTSFTVSEQEARECAFERRVVPIVTLDEVVREGHGRIPDLVKIDAEGFEPLVMHGARSLIGKTEVFLLEACLKPPPPHWPTTLELLTMMDEYGYDLFDITTLQRHEGELALAEIAFVRRGGCLRPQSEASTARRVA
jgi:FkbM family methyltransferase